MARPIHVPIRTCFGSPLPQALSQLQVTDLTVQERQVLLVLTQQLAASMDDRHSLKSIEKVCLGWDATEWLFFSVLLS